MDVEAILKEIRNRVVAADQASDTISHSGPSNGSAWQSSQTESLTRVSAHVGVTGRAWDRLPPVVSDRRGAAARLELWIKRTSKRLTRWFTWEQVNFNRAVKDALADVVEILKADAQELATLRAQLAHEARERRELEAAVTRLSDAVSGVTDASSNLGIEHSKLANQVIELASQLRAEISAGDHQQNQEVDRRLSDLAAELKDEQRVCFRQLSLESNESAVLEDRARRALLTRLEKLEQALKGPGL